jgi:hypothetical protein
MISTYIDVTADFNTNNGKVIDISGWDWVVAQFVTPSGTISITASNDSGDVTGAIDGNPATATNFNTVQATKLADGTSVTSVAASGLYRVGVVGRFLKFGGASAAATKVIVQLAKIS